jgi:cobalt-zinc-cadmium efflux system outer membrane protein
LASYQSAEEKPKREQIARVSAEAGLETSQDPLPTTPVGYALNEIEQQALENNPAIAQASARIEALQGKLTQVGLRPNPEFGYFGEIGDSGTAGQQGVYWNREIIRGGKLELNREVVCREIEAAALALEIEQQRVLSDVRTQFYRLLVAQKRLELAREFQTLTETAVTFSKRLLEAGEIAELALLQTELQAKTTYVVVRNEEVEVAGAAERLAALIGWSQGIETLQVAGVLEPEATTLNREAMLNQLEAASPELARSYAQLERSQQNLRRQQAEQVPDLQLQTSVRHNYANGDELVGIQLGRPLQVNNWNQGNIRSAQAEIVQATQNIERIRRDLGQRFANTWKDYQAAVVRVEQFQTEIIPVAQRIYGIAENGFRNGETGYLDLITAQRGYLQANLDYTVALQDYWTSLTLLDGYLLSDSLQVAD